MLPIGLRIAPDSELGVDRGEIGAWGGDQPGPVRRIAAAVRRDRAVGRIAAVGVPSLLVFLAVGLLATELPGAPSISIPVSTAALIGNLALAVILLDGGLRTRFGTLRMVAAPALTLATLGVVITARPGRDRGLDAWLDCRYGLLLGAIVGSTDAAAVFSVLGGGGLRRTSASRRRWKWKPD